MGPEWLHRVAEGLENVAVVFTARHGWRLCPCGDLEAIADQHEAIDRAVFARVIA